MGPSLRHVRGVVCTKFGLGSHSSIMHSSSALISGPKISGCSLQISFLSSCNPSAARRRAGCITKPQDAAYKRRRGKHPSFRHPVMCSASRLVRHPAVNNVSNYQEAVVRLLGGDEGNEDHAQEVITCKLLIHSLFVR